MSRRRAASPAGVTRLPVFLGWTVDERLQEFRMADADGLLCYCPFSSEQGKQLLAAYQASKRRRA